MPGQEGRPARHVGNVFGLLQRTRNTSDKPVNARLAPVPWLAREVGTPEIHQRILAHIATLKERGSPLRLHYYLYDLLSTNHGKLPKTLINANIATRRRLALVERIVPDITVSIYMLEQAGYTLLDDPIQQIREPEPIAEGMKSVMLHAWIGSLDEHGDAQASVYPLQEKVLESVVLDNIRRGLQDTFAVFLDGQMIATFCNVKKTNAYGRLPYVELGRTATDYRYLPELKERGLTLRGISQLRYLHLLMNATYNHVAEKPLDFMYSDIRISGRTRRANSGQVLVPDSRSVQGIFFGGITNQKNPVDLGFGIWGVGWPYVMGDQRDNTGGCEPFLRIGEHLAPDRMSRLLQDRIIWLPNRAIQTALAALLSSVTDDRKLTMRVLPPAARTSATQHVDPPVLLNPGLATAYTSIDFVHATREAAANTSGLVDAALVMPFSTALRAIIHKQGPIDHNVPYIEAYCECTTPNGPASQEDGHTIVTIMDQLLELGFTATGILPSDKTNGIRVTFALITRHGLEKGLEPFVFPPEYYRGNRTERAITAATGILDRLKQASEAALLNYFFSS